MIIDCDSCAARPAACPDCVVSVLLGPVSSRVDLTEQECGALAALADVGMVPPLRLLPPPAQRAG